MSKMATHCLPLLACLLAACSPTVAINSMVPDEGYWVLNGEAYGEDPRQALDVYVPEPLRADAPVVVFLYGGRWSSGEKENYRFVGQALVSRGFVVMVPNYRLYPQVKFPVFVQDAALALRWAREHAPDYGGDPERLFVMGHSAGAHIAALLALDPQYLEAAGGHRDWLAGMIGLAGPYDFLPFNDDDLKDMFGPAERYALSQPIHYVDGRNPPMLLLHGHHDSVVLERNTLSLAASIRAHGGPVQTRLYPLMGHLQVIASLAAPLRFSGTVLEDIAAFIETTRPPVP
jgi:acetyl esterase/lipase